MRATGGEDKQVVARWEVWTVLSHLLLAVGFLGLCLALPFLIHGDLTTFFAESKYAYSYAIWGGIAVLFMPIFTVGRLYMLARHKGVAVALDETSVFLIGARMAKVPRSAIMDVTLEIDSSRGALGARRRKLVLTMKGGTTKSLRLVGSQEQPEQVRDALLALLPRQD